MAQFYELSYQDGVKAGKDLMALVSKIEPALKDQCNTYLAKERLVVFLDQFAARSKRRKRIPCIEGLSSLSPDTMKLTARNGWRFASPQRKRGLDEAAAYERTKACAGNCREVRAWAEHWQPIGVRSHRERATLERSATLDFGSV